MTIFKKYDIFFQNYLYLTQFTIKKNILHDKKYILAFPKRLNTSLTTYMTSVKVK